MKFKKISAALTAIAMAATMAAGMAMSASAVEANAFTNSALIVEDSADVINYTSAKFYTTSGKEAPMGMSTACIKSVSTDEDGTVTIALEESYLSVGSWNAVSVTIEACEITGGDNILKNDTLVIDAEDITTVSTDDDDYGYVNVTVTFGGNLANIINYIPQMTNPMDLQLRLY